MAGIGVNFPLQAALRARASCSVIASLLAEDPCLDLNHKDQSGETALSLAFVHGRGDVVLLLLRDPSLDVSVSNVVGHTVAHFSVQKDREPLLRLLINDARVDFSCRTKAGRNVLRYAAFSGNLLAVRCLLASGRDLGHIWWWPDDFVYNIADSDREDIARHVPELLSQFMDDPVIARHMLRVQPGLAGDWPEAVAAELYALTVLLCDGYLRSSPIRKDFPGISRFLGISGLLPLELQMVLALRSQGLAKDIITSPNSEPAFRSLLKGHFV